MYTWNNIDKQDLRPIVDFIETQCSGERLNEERLYLIKLLTDEYYKESDYELRKTKFILHKAIPDMLDLMIENEDLKRALDNLRENLISEMQKRINELKEIKHKKI